MAINEDIGEEFNDFIEVYLHSKGTKFLQSGGFSVPNSDYKKNPN
jgi:hypothetical protein